MLKVLVEAICLSIFQLFTFLSRNNYQKLFLFKTDNGTSLKCSPSWSLTTRHIIFSWYRKKRNFCVPISMSIKHSKHVSAAVQHFSGTIQHVRIEFQRESGSKHFLWNIFKLVCMARKKRCWIGTVFLFYSLVCFYKNEIKWLFKNIFMDNGNTNFRMNVILVILHERLLFSMFSKIFFHENVDFSKINIKIFIYF